MRNDSIYMALPGTDLDRIEWIKANDVVEASIILGETLDLTEEELGEYGYHILQVPNKELYGAMKSKCISRVDTNFGEYLDLESRIIRGYRP